MLSPTEQILWQAFYSLEPYGNVIKSLAFIEAGIRKEPDVKSLFPPECRLDEPLLTADPEKQEEHMKNELTFLATAMFADNGMDLKKEIDRIVWEDMVKNGLV